MVDTFTVLSTSMAYGSLKLHLIRRNRPEIGAGGSVDVTCQNIFAMLRLHREGATQANGSLYQEVVKRYKRQESACDEYLHAATATRQIARLLLMLATYM